MHWSCVLFLTKFMETKSSILLCVPHFSPALFFLTEKLSSDEQGHSLRGKWQSRVPGDSPGFQASLPFLHFHRTPCPHNYSLSFLLLRKRNISKTLKSYSKCKPFPSHKVTGRFWYHVLLPFSLQLLFYYTAIAEDKYSNKIRGASNYGKNVHTHRDKQTWQ